MKPICDIQKGLRTDMKITCDCCGGFLFYEEIQLENMDGVTKETRFLYCCICRKQLFSDPPNVGLTLRKYGDAILVVEEGPPIEIYEVSYQEEAFPWDQWAIKKVESRTRELNKPYEDHSSGITCVICVLIEADNQLDAKIAGGTILTEYLKNENNS